MFIAQLPEEMESLLQQDVVRRESGQHGPMDRAILHPSQTVFMILFAFTGAGGLKVQLHRPVRVDFVKIADIQRIQYASFTLPRLSLDRTQPVSKVLETMQGDGRIFGCNQEVNIRLVTKRAVWNRVRDECEALQNRKRNSSLLKCAAD